MKKKKTVRDRKFYLNAFLSNECQCGRTKTKGYSFCFRCYKDLPDDMQKALYQKMGSGYESAYDEACEFLNR